MTEMVRRTATEAIGQVPSPLADLLARIKVCEANGTDASGALATANDILQAIVRSAINELTTEQPTFIQTGDPTEYGQAYVLTGSGWPIESDPEAPIRLVDDNNQGDM